MALAAAVAAPVRYFRSGMPIVPAGDQRSLLPSPFGCEMIPFLGGQKNGQICRCDLLYCHRIHSGSRVSLTVQDADHGQRHSPNGRRRSEMRNGASHDPPPGRDWAEGSTLMSSTPPTVGPLIVAA